MPHHLLPGGTVELGLGVAVVVTSLRTDLFFVVCFRGEVTADVDVEGMAVVVGGTVDDFVVDDVGVDGEVVDAVVFVVAGA